jgi:hypothetical protein
MSNFKHLSWGAGLSALVLVLGCAGADGPKGDPGPAGDAGTPGVDGKPGAQGDAGTVPDLVGEIDGTVTSDGTKAITGVTVTAVPGTGTATTDATGAFKLTALPIGAYALTFHAAGFIDKTVDVPVNVGGVTKVNVVLAADMDGAVGPTVTVTDQLAVGYKAAVTVKATVAGTGPFTYSWVQGAGLPVTITGGTTDTITFTTPDLATSMGSTATTVAPQITYARFGVLGINPDQAGHSTFKVTVKDTSTGLSTTSTVEVWSTRPTTGLREVPVGIPVHLQGDNAYLFIPFTPVCAASADCPTGTTGTPTCTVAKGTCGCTADTDCGGATSGLYCKTGVCTAGCNKVGAGNACPSGLTCTATATATGSCTSAQKTWNWTLDITGATGSTATISDATTQFPSFKPDVKGIYKATETVSGQTMKIYAGKWLGEMTSDYSAPSACATCHSGTIAPDMFTPWKTTNHSNALQRKISGSAGTHFGESCLQCHTVGYDKYAANGGFDDLEATSGWTFPKVPATLDPTTANWTALVSNATQGPLAGIQCENCHGPQDQPTGGPHTTSTTPANSDIVARISWSSEVCASCHQENPNHYFPSQWDKPGNSFVGHANRDVAIREGAYEKMAPSFSPAGIVVPQGNNLKYCGRCHSAQGFAQYAKQINAGYYGFITNDNLPLSASNHPATGLELKAKGMQLSTVESQTCQTCHDPHFNDPTTHLHQLRIYDTVKAIPNGMSNVSGMGTGAICIACHNGRNGEHSDFAQNTIDFATGQYVANPTMVGFPTEHDGPQAEVMFGFSAFFMPRYNPSAHLAVADTCAGCHVKIATGSEIASMQTSNHSFSVDSTICATCHGTGSTAVDGVALQAANQTQIDALRFYFGSKMTSVVAAAVNYGITFNATTPPPATPMTVSFKPYDIVSDSSAGTAVDLVATGNAPTSMSGMYAKNGTSFLVVLNVPNAVTFTPAGWACDATAKTCTGGTKSGQTCATTADCPAVAVTTKSLAVSFTSIATNQAVPPSAGWPALGAYTFTVWGPPGPATGTIVGTYPTVPQPAWVTPAISNTVQTLMKAYWNISVINNDGTKGIHNPSFFNNTIQATTNALKALP